MFVSDRPIVPLTCLSAHFCLAVKVLADSLEEVEHGVVLQQVIKSGGANYGNGVRSDGTGLPTTKR